MAGAFYEDVWDWWDYGATVPGLASTAAWYYAEYLAAYYGADQVPLPPTDIYYRNLFERTVRQKAVFGELTYDLTDSWSVTGGARWFEFERQEVESNEVPAGLPVFDYDPDVGYFLASPLVSEGKDDDVVMKLATQYRFDDTKMLYALYSEGFRAGGQNSRRAAQRGVVPESYNPDVLENYELGFKSQWLDNRVLVNLSLFFMEWSDIQLRADASADDPWWVEGTFNGGKAEQKGVELQVEWQVNDRFSFEIGGFLADPEFSESFTTPAGSPIEAGWPMPDSPDQKLLDRIRISRARLPDPGRGFLDAVLVFLPGRVLEQPDGDPMFREPRRRRRTLVRRGRGGGRCGSARSVVRHEYPAVRRVVEQRLGCRVDRPKPVRRRCCGLHEQQRLRRILRRHNSGPDSRFRYRVTPQRPRNVSLSFTKRW